MPTKLVRLNSETSASLAIGSKVIFKGKEGIKHEPWGFEVDKEYVVEGVDEEGKITVQGNGFAVKADLFAQTTKISYVEWIDRKLKLSIKQKVYVGIAIDLFWSCFCVGVLIAYTIWPSIILIQIWYLVMLGAVVPASILTVEKNIRSKLQALKSPFLYALELKNMINQS